MEEDPQQIMDKYKKGNMNILYKCDLTVTLDSEGNTPLHLIAKNNDINGLIKIYQQGKITPKLKVFEFDSDTGYFELTMLPNEGLSNEDIFKRVLKEADISSAEGKPFFSFVMTTSNHKPYTYPEGKIDIPSGTGRNGAVKYTDYAIGKFLRNARNKPWYKNTVFIIMADHCASSAGKWELDVANYRIPAILVNFDGLEQQKINIQCSQIDVMPTVFSLMGWEYKNNFFGRNVFALDSSEQRAFIGNYRKLGLLKSKALMVLGDGKTANQYQWDPEENSLKKSPMDTLFLNEAISYYQVADFLYNHGGLNSNLGL